MSAIYKMKNLAILVFFALALALAACNNSGPKAMQNSNSNQAAQRDEKMQSVVSHTTENQPPPGNSVSQPTGPARNGPKAATRSTQRNSIA